MQDYFRKYLRQELETKPEGQIQTAMLAHMATGSGKTYTIGNFVNYLFDLRKTFMKVNKSKDVPRIHALVLNDRINLINQLKTDFLEGRSDKPSLVNKVFQENITSRTFHSKSDDIEHKEDQLLSETGEIDIEVSGKWGDTFDFSTFQTAVNGLPIQDQPNLIIVDEAHHLAAPTYYNAFLQFYKPDAQGVYPLVLLMSATPDKILHLTGDPLVRFGLPEWIASEYSPKVNYNLVTNNQITPQDIERINSEIARISQIEDLRQRKREIQLLKEWEDGQWGINAMLRRYNSNDELVLDLLERVEKLDHTIIFCPNIEIVDQVTELINFYAGDENTAIPFHSKIDEADDSVLAKYNSGQSKVIVAVGKLNEGIDMPQTNNVIFWRETESPTIFQQQFGRWLRGDEVNIYDYVWGIRNLAWINSINESIDEIVSTEEEKTKERTTTDFDDTREKEIKHISIVMEGVGDIGQGTQHTVDIQDIVFKMQDLELTCDLTKEMVEEYFRDKDFEEMKKLDQLQRRSIKIWWNGLHAIATLYEIQWNPIGYTRIRYDLLNEIYDTKINRKELWEDGRVEIEGELYQWVWYATPKEQLRGMAGQMANRRVQKKIKEDSKWGEENVKQANGKGGEVQVVRVSELEKLIKISAGLQELWEDGRVKIEGELYQWAWYTTPEVQLRGMAGHVAKRRIEQKIKEDSKWEEENVKQAKGKAGEVQVVKVSELEKLIRTSAGLKELWEDGKVEIDWDIYQRVWAKTPSDQIRGVNGRIVNRRVEKKIKEDSKWWEENVKQAKSKAGEVQVVKISELEKLIRVSAGLQELWEDGKVKIEDELYQWVGANTSSNELWWFNGQFVKRKVDSKVKEDSKWWENNIKQAKSKRWEVQVVKLSELKKLLGKS